MSKKRINFTGRQRIIRDHVQIEVHEQPGSGSIIAHASCALAGYEFPATSQAILEAYRPSGLQYERSSAITLGAGEIAVELNLNAFADHLDCLFRLLVVAPGDSGLVLGLAKQLRPRDNSGNDSSRSSILPVERAEIGPRLWKLELDAGAPVLLVTSNATLVPDHREFVRHPMFLALVMPDVLERCLFWAIDRNPESIEEDESAWWWCVLGQDLSGRPTPDAPPDSDEAQEFIVAAVDGFCRRHGIHARYQALSGEIE